MVVVVVYVAVVGEGRGRLLLLEVGLVVEEEAEEKLTPYQGRRRRSGRYGQRRITFYSGAHRHTTFEGRPYRCHRKFCR